MSKKGSGKEKRGNGDTRGEGKGRKEKRNTEEGG